MACASSQSDRDMFPSASKIVRVQTARWKKHHTKLLDRLLELAEAFIGERMEQPFPELLRELDKHDFRIRTGDQFVHILYGPTPFYLSDDGELRMDIRGLVYRPLPRVVDGSLVIDFGED